MDYRDSCLSPMNTMYKAARNVRLDEPGRSEILVRVLSIKQDREGKQSKAKQTRTGKLGSYTPSREGNLRRKSNTQKGRGKKTHAGKARSLPGSKSIQACTKVIEASMGVVNRTAKEAARKGGESIRGGYQCDNFNSKRHFGNVAE